MEKETTLGNKLKFKLEMMFTMLAAGRDEQAAEMYNQLIAEFDKLGPPAERLTMAEARKQVSDQHYKLATQIVDDYSK
jgi:enhancing lycopene biosynthesis protein 2